MSEGETVIAVAGSGTATLGSSGTSQKVVIVAHSGGTAAALAYAAEHPGRVAGILMVDPITDPRTLPAEVRQKLVADLSGPKSLETLRGFYGSIAGENTETRLRILADVDRVYHGAHPGIGKAFAEWNPDATLRAFNGPMVALVTKPNDNPGALYKLNRAIAHHVIEGSGHWLQLDRPRIVEDAIEKFVASVEGAGKPGSARAH